MGQDQDLKTYPYWWEDGAPLPDLPKTPPEKCEILVIGGGFTGLSAAIAAAENGAQVCVLDAGTPGQGASTRNGGMAGAHPRLSLAAMSEKFGSETAKAMFNEAPLAFDHLKSLIARYKIDCDYQNSGRIQLAWTKADFAAQRALAADMNANTDFSVDVVERADLGEHIATSHYFGGLFYEGHGALHPRKLHDGLMRAAHSLGVQIIQNCPATDITATGAQTPNGRVSADKVIVTTNGYTKGKGLLGWLSKRVYPLPSYIIATEPLSQEVLDRIAPGRRMMVETRARHSYYRPSPDGTRILWGGRAAIRQISPERAVARLKSSMTQIWPELRDVKITHAWKGNTGFTFEQAPHVGQKDGVFYAMGYCGGGVVLSPYLGRKAALQALGDAGGQTAYSDTTLATRPYFFGGFPWFLEIADRWFTFVVDPLQNRTASRDKKSGR